MAELTDVQLRSLLVARGLIDRAESAVDGTPPGAMAAVILYDTAVETAAKAALGTVSPANLPKQYGREGLPEALASLSKEKGEAGEIADARRLHDLRNTVQHDGVSPPEDEVRRTEIRARAFLEWVAREFFDADIWQLSRAALINDEAIREQIEQAEAFGRDRLLDLGADRLAIAFELARDRFRAGALSNPLLRINSRDIERVAAVSRITKLAGFRARLT